MMLGKAILVLGVSLTLAAATACTFFNAAPSECIAAAEDAGLPDPVIEQLRDPDGLNAVERAALQRTLKQSGIDDACDDIAGAAPTTSREAERNDATEAEETEDDDDATEERPENDTKTASDPGDREPSQPDPSNQPSGARIPQDDEHRRRCQFWALNHLEPVVYSEFTQLNPDTMDDLDRILWRSTLTEDNFFGFYEYASGPELLAEPPNKWCRDYWAEPLNRANAELRNHRFEAKCRGNLEALIKNQYRRMADSINHHDDENELVYNWPNQYVRILEWLDLSGDDLLNSDHPPYRILEEQSEHLYAHLSKDWIPSEDGLEDYKRETEETLNLEWMGILEAAGLNKDSSDLLDCHRYYPQLFYGYWIPFNPAPTPRRSQLEEPDLPRYEGAATPLYLPKSVTLKTVKPGYPLGGTAERYHLCNGGSQTEEVDYYYVEHPAGDYCELKP